MLKILRCHPNKSRWLTITSSLVYAELRIVASKLFRCLDMSLDSSMTKSDMNQLDCFTTSFEGIGVRVFIRGERS